MDHRTALLRSKLPLDGRGLEIGPSYNPLIPKSEGFNVETVDYTDADGLRAKYDSNPHVDIGRIEEVDHVVSGETSLSDAIGKHGYYDYAVASHVIEHTPDLVSFLQSLENLLSADGVLMLAVPDKRHCFDVLQPLSSTGTIMQAHIEGRKRPGPGSIFDDVAYNAVRGDAIGWSPNDTNDLRFFASLDNARRLFEESRHDEEYRDVHVWRFVPSSFRLIVHDLAAIGAISLKESWFHDSVGNEFYICLSRSGTSCTSSRLELAQEALREHSLIRL